MTRLQVLLTDRRVPWLLAFAFTICGFVFVVRDYTLNDEGLMTYTTAAFLRHDFATVFFAQRAKPVLSLFYIVPVWFSLNAYLMTHVLAAASAIVLIASTARAMGIAAPNAAAAIVAFSPVHLLGGAAGLSNSDGFAATCLCLYLAVARNRRFAAGLVLGLLPWIRHELALFCLLWVLHDVLIERRWSLAAGTLVFPVAYWLSGIVYQSDALWLLHYSPAGVQPPGSTANNPVMPISHTTFAWSKALPYLFTISPLAPAMFAFRARGVTRTEWLLFAYAVLWLVLAAVLPTYQIANFGFVPRYLTPALPAIALLGARAVGQWSTGDRPRIRWALVILAITEGLWWLWWNNNAALHNLLIASTVGMLVLVAARRSAPFVACLMAIVISGPALGLPSGIAQPDLAAYLSQADNWVRTHRDEIRAPIFTNVMLLAPYLNRHGLPGMDVRYLLGVDQLEDMRSMTNSANGQFQAAVRMMKEVGWADAACVFTDSLTPADVPEGSLFLFRTGDKRVWLVLPREVWGSHLQPVVQGEIAVYQFER